MNDLYEIDRRLFLIQFCAVTATAALIGSALKAETPAAVTQEDSAEYAQHVSFRGKGRLLSHLPMFDGLNTDQDGNVIKDKDGKTEYTSPHRYQVILEAASHRAERTSQHFTATIARATLKREIYTFESDGRVCLAKLVTPGAQKPELSSFRATVFAVILNEVASRLSVSTIVETVKQDCTCPKVQAPGRQVRGTDIPPVRQRTGPFSRPLH